MLISQLQALFDFGRIFLSKTSCICFYKYKTNNNKKVTNESKRKSKMV